MDGKSSIVEGLFKDTLKERFDISDDAVGAMQAKYLEQTLTSALCTPKLSSCVDSMARCCRAVISQADHFVPAIIAQAKQVLLLIDLPKVSLSGAEKTELKNARQGTYGDGLPCLLLKFPVHGHGIIAAVDLRLAEFDSGVQWADNVKKDIEVLRKGYGYTEDDQLGEHAQSFLDIMTRFHAVTSADVRCALKDSMPAEDLAFQQAEASAIETLLAALACKWVQVQARVGAGSNLEIWSVEARRTDAAHFTKAMQGLKLAAAGDAYKQHVDTLHMLVAWAASWCSKSLEMVESTNDLLSGSIISIADGISLIQLFDGMPTLGKMVENVEIFKQSFQIVDSWVEKLRPKITEFLHGQISGPWEQVQKTLRPQRHCLPNLPMIL